MRFSVVILAALGVAMASGPLAAQKFEFIAYGDMPYNIPADYAKVERLVDRINTIRPAFAFFVGDTKSGSDVCSNEIIDRARNVLFERIAGAAVYSVGDNEWTDCHRDAAGRFDPLERLEYVRKTHFSSAMSLGQQPIKLTRQSDIMPQYAKYVENSRFQMNGVMVVSVHIPGSNNNFETRPGAPEEYFARNAANLAWINAAFDEAARAEIRGLIFGFQADMWGEAAPRPDVSSGYTDTLAVLTARSEALGKPVLFVHGDNHLLRIDQPLRNVRRHTVENVTRLMVMGAAEVQAVKVTVDPAEPGLFSFTPIRIPENAPSPRS